MSQIMRAKHRAINVSKDNFDELRDDIIKSINFLQVQLATLKKPFDALSAVEIGMDLPVIVVKNEDTYTHMICPKYKTTKPKDTRHNVERSFLFPEIEAVVMRPQRACIVYLGYNNQNELKLNTKTFTGNKCGKVVQCLEQLEGQFYLNKALKLTHKKHKHPRVFRGKFGDNLDYFIENDNKLFFSGLVINPLDYKKDELEPVGNFIKE